MFGRVCILGGGGRFDHVKMSVWRGNGVELNHFDGKHTNFGSDTYKLKVEKEDDVFFE